MTRLRIALAAILFVAPSVSSGAQDMHEVQRRLTAATTLQARASRELIDYRIGKAARTYSDTFAIGGAVRVITTADLRTVVQAAAEQADASLRARVATALSVADGEVLFVRTDSALREARLVSVGQKNGKAEIYNRRAPIDPGSLAKVLDDEVRLLLLGKSSPELAVKLAGVLPIDSAQDDEWAAVRLTLATSLSVVARRCLDQDVSACKTVLGFPEVSDPSTQLYDSAGRRALVGHTLFNSTVDKVARQRCLEGRDRACIDLLRRDGTADAYRGQAHLSLAKQAVAMGGKDATLRLLTTRGSEADVLAAVARTSFDSLVAAWARNVRGRGIASSAFTPGVALIALGWTLVMALLSLRSSRWR